MFCKVQKGVTRCTKVARYHKQLQSAKTYNKVLQVAKEAVSDKKQKDTSRCYKIQQGAIRYKSARKIYKVLEENQGASGCNKVLQGALSCYKVLEGTTKCDKVL